jgi:hypothetical protein
MIAMVNDYFSESYADSREKFLKAVNSDNRFSVESVCIRDDLFIDFAFLDSGKKDKILFLVSGTHGVEGYLGSAAQLLFIKEFLPQLNDVSVCLVHALNPYGFKHNRRVNENNVDLNRNSIYDERLMLGIPNTFFSNVWSDSLLFLKLNRPRKHRILELFNYYAILIKAILKSGVKNTIDLGIAGQSSYPNSVAFKGVKLEDSLLHLRHYIEEKTQGYADAFFIDVHSGLGRKYEVQGFTNEIADSQGFFFIKRLLRNIKYKTKANHSPAGSINELFLARSHAVNNVELTLEYGTIPMISSRLIYDYLAKVNIEENQVFFFGNDKKREAIQKKLKKAYSPMDVTFKKSLIKKTSDFFSKLVVEYNN